MDARNNIATDLFYKVRSRFSGLKLGAETGEITINPEEARFFDFDYMEGKTPIGHVSISLAEPNSMKVYFSHGISEGMDEKQKVNWYGFLKELRQFAKRRLLSFDTRDIAKDNLDRRDYEFLVQNSQPKQTKQDTIQKPVGESMMAESNMYGSRTMSYQKLMDTRLIIKHNQAVMDENQPGARTRHIGALFVENQDGERFKYPFIHLAGARAMQRHVANGGVPYDDLGKSIIGMSEEIAQLKSFGNYVVRNDLMNSDTNSVVERSTTYLNQLREQIKALSKQSHYEAYKENFQAYDSEEIPQDVVEDFKEKFTVKSFKEDIASVFPVLYRLMKEENIIGYDDIVAMTQEEIANEDVEVGEEAYDPFDQFESWVMALGEESAITSEDPEAQATAVQGLQELVGQPFPAGVDGTNAIESLKGIIEDPELYKRIKAQATEDAEADMRPQIQAWLELNAPEALEQLDFGDMVTEPEAAQGGDQTAPEEEPVAVDPAAAEAPAEQPQMADFQQEAGIDPNRHPQSKDYGTGDDEDDLPFDPDENPTDKDEFGNTIKNKARHLARKGMRQAMDVKELAEFITSFYDRDSGTFPKGPEGVVIMVGKKFGEQAEQVARKFVERMAPQQQDPQIAELARIRELAGMPGNDMAEDSEDRVKFRGTDHDIGEERYRFVIDGDTIFFNFPSDEDNPDPDSPSFEEILARVQRSGEVRHYRITPAEQQAIAKKIAAERQRYLDQRRQDMAEGDEQVYKVVAVEKSNALKKPTNLNVKASSIEDVFSRLAVNDWYALSINGVEVIAGKRLKQGVAEGSLNEEAGNIVVRRLIAEFNEQISGSPYYPLDYKDVGMRSWTRGDGSRYKDPGYIMIDREMNPRDMKKYSAQKPIEKFWQFLSDKGARKIGDVSGEFGSDPHSPAVALGKLIFVNNGRNIAWGSASRLKNSSVWRQKQQGVAEGSDRTSDKVADALAQKGVKYTREKEQEIIDLIGEVLANMGMDTKQIRYLTSYDEDFVSDVLDALPREDAMQDDIAPELEDIRRLSGIAQGIGY